MAAALIRDKAFVREPQAPDVAYLTLKEGEIAASNININIDVEVVFDLDVDVDIIGVEFVGLGFTPESIFRKDD